MAASEDEVSGSSVGGKLGNEDVVVADDDDDTTVALDDTTGMEVPDVKGGGGGGEDEETESEPEDMKSSGRLREPEASTSAIDDRVKSPTRIRLSPSKKRPLAIVPGSGPSPSAAKPKMRIRLSLKLPLSGNAKKSATPPVAKGLASGGNTLEVAQTGFDGDNAVNAAMPPTSAVSSAKSKETSKVKVVKRSLPISKVATGSTSKRRSFQPSKQIRLPPITSPGLLMVRPPNLVGHGPKQAAAAASSVLALVAAAASSSTGGSSATFTPQLIFETTMSQAGYTREERALHPHRGSSTERTIGDVFDTNVKLSLHMPELFPEELWNKVVQRDGQDQDGSLTLPQLLISALEKAKDDDDRLDGDPMEVESRLETRTRPRYAMPRLKDMLPVSLTIPYPEEYVKKRLEYVEDVQSRERAIVQWQAAQEELEIAKENYEFRAAAAVGSSSSSNADGEAAAVGDPPSFTNPVVIPPIPIPPDPPLLQDLVASPDTSDDGNGATSLAALYEPGDDGTVQHPMYLPKGKEHFVAHFDKNCFHITEGRYFGLTSNLIMDPNFVGPNAPGLAALSSTGSGGGLATATTSTTTSTSGLSGGGMTMILSASFHCAAAAATSSNKDDNSTGGNRWVPPHEAKDESGGNSTDAIALGSGETSIPDTGAAKGEGVPIQSANKRVEFADTVSGKSASDLRKIMEDESDSALAETFKDWIIRAAVHSGRTERKESSFRGPNGEVYQDLGKAFTLYSGVKPCERCKSNKQGVRFHSFRVFARRSPLTQLRLCQGHSLSCPQTPLGSRLRWR
jgi:hypothetical protein